MTEAVSVAASLATLVLAFLTYRMVKATVALAGSTKQLAQETKRLADETAAIAGETRRAAAAAEASTATALRALEIEEGRRGDELQANLVPVQWGPKRGIVVKNVGRGNASDIFVSTWDSSSLNTMESKATGLTLAPGDELDAAALRMKNANWSGADQHLNPGQDGVLTRWMNSDESQGAAGWQPFQPTS